MSTPSHLRIVILAFSAAIGLATNPVFAFDRDDLVIKIAGENAELAGILERTSSVVQALNDDRTSPIELIAAARSEYRQMLGALYAQAHYSPIISVTVNGLEVSEISPLHEPDSVKAITISIQPGPIFKFQTAKIGPLTPQTDIPGGFETGKTATVSSIKSAASSSISAWRSAGHAKAEITDQNIVADHESNHLDVDITITPGPRLKFGDLNITGNKDVRSDRIRIIAGLPVGAVYNPTEIEQSATRLRRTEAFASVTFTEAENIGPQNSLPIELTLTEERPRRVGFGAELSSVEGFGTNAYWLHRNLLGGAEQLRFDFEIDNIGATDAENGVDYTFSTNYGKPAAFGTDKDFYTQLVIAREDEPSYLSDTIDLEAGMTRIVSNELQWQIGGLYRIGDIQDAFGDRQYQLVGSPFEVTWDTRDAPLNATQGTYINTNLVPFLGINDIDNGLLLTFDGRKYLALGEEKSTVLAGRVQFGTLAGPDSDSAPPDYLFYAGGGGSVRGQPYQALGIGEIDDMIIGGTSYLALSGEIRATVRGNFGAVAFYDAGYVGDEAFLQGEGSWLSGAGLGLRYQTGFGPLRADIAFPVSGTPDDASQFQIYIGIGQAF